eukprot:GHVH01010964.1.p1 GENE.GHVH01010964.1~~GHVH01010964.1.p1  ORF type:complete len:626 (-),score=81.69 GHVH01010964.1:86-1963(-)
MVDSLEYEMIKGYIASIAMRHPNCKFSCKNLTVPSSRTGGRSLSGSDAIRSRFQAAVNVAGSPSFYHAWTAEECCHVVTNLFGKHIAKELIAFDFRIPYQADEAFADVRGLVSHPNASVRASEGSVLFFLNERLISHDLLKKRIEQLFVHLVPKGRSCWVFLDINVPGSKVDVNVHPSKRIVSLQEDNWITEHIQQEIQKILGDQHTSRRFAITPISSSSATTSRGAASSSVPYKVRSNASTIKLSQFFTPKPDGIPVKSVKSTPTLSIGLEDHISASPPCVREPRLKDILDDLPMKLEDGSLKHDKMKLEDEPLKHDKMKLEDEPLKHDKMKLEDEPLKHDKMKLEEGSTYVHYFSPMPVILAPSLYLSEMTNNQCEGPNCAQVQLLKMRYIRKVKDFSAVKSRVHEWSFIGSLDSDRCFVQENDRLLVVRLKDLLTSALDMSILSRLGRLPSVTLEPPVSIELLLKDEIIMDPLLPKQRDYLRRWLSICISDTHMLTAIPRALGGYFSGRSNLRPFIRDILTNIQLQNETESLLAMTRSVSDLYCSMPSFEDRAYPDQVVEWTRIQELVHFPALKGSVVESSQGHDKNKFIPGMNSVLLEHSFSENIQEIAHLKDLYKVFERC